MTALTLFSVKGNSRSPSSWIFKKVSTRSSASNLPLLVVMLSLCSLTIFWSILSTLSCSFSSLLLIPVTWSTHFTEGKTSAAQKPVASSAISVTAPMNESWSLHFFPKAALAISSLAISGDETTRVETSPSCRCIRGPYISWPFLSAGDEVGRWPGCACGNSMIESLALDLLTFLNSMIENRRKAKRVEEEGNSMSRMKRM